MDYGKFKYESDMKAREARRNQANTVLKEIRFRLKIDDHDYDTKKGHVERFLSAGDKVKVMIMFRGREQSRPEMGVRLLERLAQDVSELATVESSPKQDGRNMIMVLGPVKKKVETKSEQRRDRETVKSTRNERVAARHEKAAQEQANEAPDEEQTEYAAPVVVPVEAVAQPEEVAPVEAVVQPQEVAPVAVEAPAEPEAVAKAPAAKAPASKPATAKPAVAKTTAAKPATAKPAGSKPAAAKPASTKPAAAKPAVAKPASKPAAPRPAAKPGTAKPVAGKPVAAKPAVKKETDPKASAESAEKAN